jgi:hypothetical protein
MIDQSSYVSSTIKQLDDRTQLQGRTTGWMQSIPVAGSGNAKPSEPETCGLRYGKQTRGTRVQRRFVIFAPWRRRLSPANPFQGIESRLSS